jgi:hypothetical protein
MPATTPTPPDVTEESKEQHAKAQAHEAEAEARKVENVEEKQDELDPALDDPQFVSPRDPKLKTAELNSAPHPELWPAPDTDPDAERPEGTKAEINIVPRAPSVNFEYVIKAGGLPVNSGLTVLLEQDDQPDVWLTHKSDPYGDAHIVWRTREPGKVSVKFFTREDGEKGKAVASGTYEIVSPVNDRRFGEARGFA